MRQRRLRRTPVQRPQLDHVVHETHDGLGPRLLLLQLSDVRPQVRHQPLGVLLVLDVGRELELGLGALDGLVEGGGLAAEMDQDEDELLVTLAQEILSGYVKEIPLDFLSNKKNMSLLKTCSNLKKVFI